jgi:hypothetical protein
MGRKPAAPPPKVKEAPLTKAVEPGAPRLKVEAPGKQPKIVFEEMEYDFGKLMGVDKIEHVFKFRNEGEADLTIDKVNTTCGCTAALPSVKVIPPGGQGELKTTFTVGKRQGKQTKRIYVLSNDPSSRRTTLTIKGFIIPAVEVQPASVFLKPKEGTVSMKVVKISQTMDEELEIGDVTSRLNLVNTHIKEEPAEDGKKRYSLEISLKPDIDPGRYFEKVTVATNCAAKPKIDIPIRIRVEGDIEASPRRVNLGSLETGQEVSRPITVSNTKGQPFKVERIEVKNNDFTISPEASTTSSPSHAFTLTVIPSAERGGVRTNIIFHLDHPKQKKVEVSAYGYIRKLRHAPTPEDEEEVRHSQEIKAQPTVEEVKPSQETKAKPEDKGDKPPQKIKAQPKGGEDKPPREKEAKPEGSEKPPLPPPPPARP